MSDEELPALQDGEFLVETYFVDGPLGVTLRRKVESGKVYVFQVVADSQAVDLDVVEGDELWAVRCDSL